MKSKIANFLKRIYRVKRTKRPVEILVGPKIKAKRGSVYWHLNNWEQRSPRRPDVGLKSGSLPDKHRGGGVSARGCG